MASVFSGVVPGQIALDGTPAQCTYHGNDRQRGLISIGSESVLHSRRKEARAGYREIVGALRLLAERDAGRHDAGRHIERNTARITTTRIKLFLK